MWIMRYQLRAGGREGVCVCVCVIKFDIVIIKNKYYNYYQVITNCPNINEAIKHNNKQINL